jgi:hypothetical protein
MQAPHLGQCEGAKGTGQAGAQQVAHPGQAETVIPLVAQHAHGCGRAHQAVGGPRMSTRPFGYLLRRQRTVGQVIRDAKRGECVQHLGRDDADEHIDESRDVRRGIIGQGRIRHVDLRC